MAPSPARLTFFCELGAGPLEALFAHPAVVEHLLALRASVSLGVLDLGPERAGVVRRLNEAGVPVVAWLLLPEAEGYWFHQGNAPQATARYEAFRAWTAAQGLRWDGVGLDIEPDIHDLRRALESRWRMLPALLPRLRRGGALREARAGYGALMARIREDGYRVDSYQLPFIVDERRAGSTLLQRLSGVLDVPADREVLMLYTSLVRPHGPGMLWSYGPDARSVGVGVTGGGVDVPGLIDVPPLDWEELARDLRLARRWTEDIHVFSLEGCVRQDFLARLRDFDWLGAVETPPPSARRVNWLRRAVGPVLRLGTERGAAGHARQEQDEA
ncbi:hypothetical protein [Vitiosangium sp. GDMCC 1.1324]|uniref:hypothetical protein n=1 Tax=Vitiosangium sp. (strain GDMCC 1.1324) TaxID=2138576 RepID=UPI000D39D4AA|nr:hypothetical protein [Vitiosangium sp. GDMCC 1.1324]PTL77554.1 hypothetical protein DAT35_42870 [Vitiosangium sp. GDMCC 1.1324]